MYLDLMKRCLLNTIYQKYDSNIIGNPPVEIPLSQAANLAGKAWPKMAHTMIGMDRLNNIQDCYWNVYANKVYGDLVECGVWRGGVTIFMAALVNSFHENRDIWVCDSFEGLPAPDPVKYPSDTNVFLNQYIQLSISLDEVITNFTNYGLLKKNVHFLKGWFKDTMPNNDIEKIAILRLDGDLYESTMETLIHLYPKVSIGGYIIVDDYNCLHSTQWAVDDFRSHHGITDDLIKVDWSEVYWCKSSDTLNPEPIPTVKHSAH